MKNFYFKNLNAKMTAIMADVQLQRRYTKNTWKNMEFVIGMIGLLQTGGLNGAVTMQLLMATQYLSVPHGLV